MKQILPALHTFTRLMMGRVYLIEDPDGLTLIDASLASAAGKIVTQLAAKGYRPTDVKRILITHAHGDHIGALPELKRLTGATVCASAAERPFVEGKSSLPYPPRESLSGVARLMATPGPTLPGTPVDRLLADGDTLPEVFGGLTVVATPGHTPGHIAFWQPEKGVLFCGDAILNLLGLRLPFAAFTTDMAENLRSIERIIALQPSVVCFGHGNPLTGDAVAALRQFARKVGAIPA